MARTITKQLAIKIASKSKAQQGKSGAHTPYHIYNDDGTLLRSFGIRHGSNKEAGHDHIPKELNISGFWLKEFASCKHDRDSLLQKLLSQQ